MRIVVEGSTGCCATNTGQHIVDTDKTIDDDGMWCVMCGSWICSHDSEFRQRVAAHIEYLNDKYVRGRTLQ